jgi:hypothetical protein
MEYNFQTGDVIFINNCAKCKYSDSLMNNGFQFLYRNTFNSFRWYLTDQVHYTHVAVVVRLNLDGEENPYLAHVDGGSPMYDELGKKWVTGNGIVLSKMDFVDKRGEAVVFRYLGSKIKPMINWLRLNHNIKYPSYLHLIAANSLKIRKNPHKIMACTDFAEYILYEMGIFKKKPSNQATLRDILNFVNENALYDRPALVKNSHHFLRH